MIPRGVKHAYLGEEHFFRKSAEMLAAAPHVAQYVSQEPQEPDEQVPFGPYWTQVRCEEEERSGRVGKASQKG
jgi:hypothetical protein